MVKNNIVTVEVNINLETNYTIEDVALFTGYSTGYIRNLERAKKIVRANRDDKGWRFWHGSEVLTIIKYCREQHAPSNNLKSK